MQLPHAKTSVQCNTLSKNITEKNNKKKNPPCKTIPQPFNKYHNYMQ